MVLRAEVRPELIEWALERSRLPEEQRERRFPKLSEWIEGERSPTLRQLEEFASATHTPVGLLFLTEPPEEHIPIPDYRTMGDEEIARPSPDLLDTIFQCQQRQDWYRTFAEVNRETPVEFIGALTTNTPIVEAAVSMRSTLGFDIADRGSTFADTFRILAEKAEDLGVLVMVNGVVGSNTRRKLNPHEFRGFALVDRLAPVVFVNGADTRAAQIFTLVHELAHLWLGESALSDADLGAQSAVAAERWCNQVAAEFLVPGVDLSERYDPRADQLEELDRLARFYKASTLVVLRRIHDAGAMDWGTYRAAYRDELERVLSFAGERGAGGNFYNTQPVRVSKRFARALITDALEGQTLYNEAFRMLGFKKQSTFDALAGRLGVT